METKTLPNHSVPPGIDGHYHYGGTITPDYVTSKWRHSDTGKKKSKVRLNDQIVPKPTDINIAEKSIKTPTPKEHPYSSHISRFAMFPSYHSPDDPEAGARAATQPYVSHVISNSAPDVTVLSKTFGAPYRHELLGSSIKTRKKAVNWSEEQHLLDNAKPLKGENQLFYPTPPKRVLPINKRCDLSLSERPSNILKNLERTHWVTSYQMDYTGPVTSDPNKIDDFKEQRQRSYPVFVPTKPNQVCRRRQVSHVGRSTCSPDLLNLSSALEQDMATATANQHRPQETTEKHSEGPDLNPTSHRQPENSTDSTEARMTESMELHHSVSYPTRPPVLPGIRPVDRAGTVGREIAGVSLLDLQNSFSKSAAQRNLNSSVTRAAVNLRDNTVTGRKHNFYGINSFYLHG